MHDTMKKDGGWTIELFHQLPTGQSSITISPLTLDAVIRWGDQEVPSTLALLSELCGIPEISLRQLRYPDVERVLLAFFSVIPPNIKADFEKGVRPLATAINELPADQRAQLADPIDPRFPYASGIVQRDSSDNDHGVMAAPPDAVSRVK